MSNVWPDPKPTVGYLPCCVEGPDAWLPKAAYALRMLLLPLGLAPRWVDRDTLRALGQGLYYGPEGNSWPKGVISVALHETTLAYFAGYQPYDARRVRWQHAGAGRWPVLFGSPDGAADPIASAFFWLSGWQEYVLRPRDVHGRVRYADSLQAMLGLATQPPVEATRMALAIQLAQHGLPLRVRRWRGHRWAFCPTFDIDYVRKWRPGMLYREFWGYLLRGQLQQPISRRLRRAFKVLQSWLGGQDPFRKALIGMMEQVQPLGSATFFLKTGATSAYDVPYEIDRHLQNWLHRLEAAGMEVGLHPSYHAATHAKHLFREQERLAQRLQQPLVSVRTHYLRWITPTTPRLLAAAGFRIDSSLGWAEHEGFRHGTCLPFQLFDIEANAPLPLWEFPLAMMESTLFVRRGLSLPEALQVTDALLTNCRRYGGLCVALWHNTLWDEMDFPGWKTHFTQTLKQVAAQDACIVNLRSALEGWY